MRTITLLVGALFMANLADAQKADPAAEAADQVVQKLTEDSKPMLPPGAENWLRAEDGRIYQWSITLPDDVDIAALAKEAGSKSEKLRDQLDDWAAFVRPKFQKMTEEAVEAAGVDPEFNPETDFEMSVNTRLPPDGRPSGGADDRDRFYWVSFTGSRRDALYGKDNTEVLRPAQGEPTGGEIQVTIVPDRQQWGHRETITGKITIKNTGKARVPMSAFWFNAVTAFDAAGKMAEGFSILGHINYGPRAMNTFLSPGAEQAATFTLITDRLHRMMNGQYLPPGKWTLRHFEHAVKNVRLKGEPAAIEVVLKEGEYAGPRILSATGAGPNLVLLRENGIVDVVEAATGKHLGAGRPPGYRENWSWRGSNLVFSSDGRQAAYCMDRKTPIQIVSFFGDPPFRATLAAPDGVTVGPGGFSPGRFVENDAKLICGTNNTWVVVNLETGKAERVLALPEMWTELSPEGSFASCLKGLGGGVVGHRGEDKYTISLSQLLAADVKTREVEIKGRGEDPDLFPGLAGAYLCDEFTSSAVYVPYREGKNIEFATGGVPIFVGESPDGSTVAFAWPRAERRGPPKPTTVGVFRVSDGEKLFTLPADSQRQVVLLSNPSRLVAFEIVDVKDAFGGGQCLRESATIYEAKTGKEIAKKDLIPAEGTLPKVEPQK